METILHAYNSSMSWTDAPCEHAQAFLDKLHWFLDAFILDKAGPMCILGKVVYYVIRLECQQRGCLHAHIMLWLAVEDVQRVARDIVAFIPTIDEHSTAYEQFIHEQITTKQQHQCRQDGCMAEGQCRYGFPFPIRTQAAPSVNPTTHRYEYMRLLASDGRTVPYHALILAIRMAYLDDIVLCMCRHGQGHARFRRHASFVGVQHHPARLICPCQ